MKKRMLAAAAATLILISVPIAAFAHNHGNRALNASYQVCNVANCHVTGRHTHNGVAYVGHYAGDGHAYHQACTVQNCTRTGVHTHNGVNCLPRQGGRRGNCYR